VCNAHTDDVIAEGQDLFVDISGPHIDSIGQIGDDRLAIWLRTYEARRKTKRDKSCNDLRQERAIRTHDDSRTIAF
jgi:hypothetical protein